jgi:hypothetical protein
MPPDDMQLPLGNSSAGPEPRRRGARGQPDAKPPTAPTGAPEDSSEPKVAKAGQDKAGSTSQPGSNAAPPPVSPSDAAANAATSPADPTLVGEILERGAKPTNRVKRRGWFTDLPDRGLFVIFLLFGVTAVMVLKLGPFESEQAKWWATGAAAFSLVGYAVLAWRLDHYRLHGDRLGDNCYYLGFLLTLASMAAALIQFDITAGDRGRVLERLIGSFGVALFSTFIGIALRVVFLQMRREVDDLEEELRRDLSDKAELLKSQLLFAVTELENFRLRTRQVLDERTIQVADLFSEQAKLQVAEVTKLAKQSAEDAARALAAQTANAAALEEAIRQQATAAAALAERLGRIEVPPDLFRQEIRELANRIGVAAAPLETSAQALATRMNNIDVPTEWLAGRMEPFTVAVGHATAAVERLALAEVDRRTKLDTSVARATAVIEEAARNLAVRPTGFWGRLAYAMGWQRTGR